MPAGPVALRRLPALLAANQCRQYIQSDALPSGRFLPSSSRRSLGPAGAGSDSCPRASGPGTIAVLRETRDWPAAFLGACLAPLGGRFSDNKCTGGAGAALHCRVNRMGGAFLTSGHSQNLDTHITVLKSQMRTQPYSRNTDSLGRYYTSSTVSSLLVDQLPAKKPRAVLDLGSGGGALSLAASKRWSKSGLVTVDVDDGAIDLGERLRQKGFQGRHAHFLHDALAPELAEVLHSSWAGLPDVAVCNPPFIMNRWRESYGSILEEVGFSGCLPAIASTDVAVLFLAQNLRLIAPNGCLGIIVPDSLVSAEKYLRFRQELLRRFVVSRATRLPRGSFGGTDALAHILLVHNMPPRTDQVGLSRLLDDGALTPTLTVDIAEAAKRLDHDFHASRSAVSRTSKRLASVVEGMCRGAMNSAQARLSDGLVLHTTDITPSMYGRWIDFSAKAFRPPAGTKPEHLAVAGDILVARVGRTAPDKVIGIAKGGVAYTDCLFRIRVPAEWRQRVLMSLTSTDGRAWLERHGCGVAARHITRSDLLNLPLVL